MFGKSFVKPRGPSLSFAILLVLLVGTGDAIAQEVTGTLYGSVEDDSGLAIPGVTVTITSPQLLGMETRVSSGTGTYRVPNLPAGTYAVKAELGGFQTVNRAAIELRAGQEIAIDITLSIATVQETITVTGESPLVDVKNVQTMRTMDAELLENIPLGRNYSDLIVTMAGVLDSEYGFTPAQTVHGSSPRSNLFNIDGASTNDTTVGYISTEIPIDMIEEVQVSTGGISAEFGLGTGGIFNFVTKSGGEQFHGTANFYYQGENLEGDNLTPELEEQIQAGTSTVKNQEWGGTIGGPIKKGTAWFFANLRRLSVEQQEPFLPAQPFNTNQWHGFAKATAQVGSNTRVNVSLTTRDQDRLPGNVSGFSNADHSETWTKFFREQRVVNLNVTRVVSDNTFLEFRLNRTFKHFFSEYPNNPDFVVGYTDRGTGEAFGGIIDGDGVEETTKRDMGQLHFNLSHFRENLGGSHDFKVGFYADRSPFEQNSFYPNGEDVRQFLRNGAPIEVELFAKPTTLSAASIDRYALFLQDQWTIGDAVTLNIGIRYVRSEGWYPEQSTGGGRFFPEVILQETRDAIIFNDFSPRVGIVWALGEEKRSSIKASYGRYYNALINQYLTIIRPSVGGSELWTWNDLNADLVFQEGENETLLRNNFNPNTTTADPNIKNQYVDSFHVGFEQQFTDNFVLSVAGIFKRERDIIETIDIGRDTPGQPFSAYDPISVTNPFDNSPLTIFALRPEFVGSQRIRFLTNPNDPTPLFRNYKALEIVANRRFADGWQFLASLNLSESYGNIGNSYGSTWGGHAIYDNPNTLINSEGPLDLDVPVQIKLQGTYVAPYDVALSAYYLGLSGFPLKPPQNFPADPALGAYTARFFRDDVPEMVVESFVDVASVPRGSFRHDFRNIVNVRAEKQFPFGDGLRFGIIADIFNLFNSSRVTTIQSLRLDQENRFLVPARIENPIILRIGLRFEF